MFLDSTANPHTLYLGTTWSKIENRFLYGTSGPVGQLGGANTIALTVDHLPHHGHSAWTDQQGNHTHTQDAHLHSQPAHMHKLQMYQNGGTWQVMASGGGNSGGTKDTTSSGGDNTGGAQPGIHYGGQHGHNVGIGGTGGGVDFSIMPQYYTVNIWKRLS